MRRKTLATAVAATAAALVVGSLGLAGMAKADPTTGQTYTTVGSNTIQNVEAALAGQALVPAGTKAAPAGTLSNVGSYEALSATNSTTITPHCGVTFNRPNGSGQGVAALSASINPGGTHTFQGKTITGCVQFARSSGGPSVTGTDLTFVPLGRDGVAYIYVGSSTDLGNLTTAQLTGIYNGTITTVGSTTVKPYIPQSGSGTRAFFLKAIGVTTLGTDVNQNASNEENTASVIAGVTGAIYPFSAADYIAQHNGYAFNTGLSSVKLGNPNSVTPTVAGTGSNLAPNPTFYSSTSTFARNVYDVFPTSEVTATTLDALASQYVVNATNLNPAACNASSQTILLDFGFLTESYCGLVSGSSSQALTGGYSYIP